MTVMQKMRDKKAISLIEKNSKMTEVILSYQ